MHQEKTTIEELFPCLMPEEEKEARHALRRYLSFILRLYARIASDPREYRRFVALTEHPHAPTIEDGRTFTSTIHDTDA